MYWNNPLILVKISNFDLDPIVQSLHGNQHCLFWNPVARFQTISTNQKLDDLIAWGNHWLEQHGIDNFSSDPRNWYDIANLTKLNMWVNDIRRQGIVKPLLLQDLGNGTTIAGTGDSRLRCLEVIPEISTVPAFISTHSNRKHIYQELEPVTRFDQFAQLCNAEPDVEFLFRLTDANAPYGLDWYEYTSSLTRAVTPSEDDAVQMFVHMVKSRPGFKITRTYFTENINWDMYIDL